MAERITALTPAPLTTVIAPQPLAAGMHTAPHFDLLELLPPPPPTSCACCANAARTPMRSSPSSKASARRAWRASRPKID